MEDGLERHQESEALPWGEVVDISLLGKPAPETPVCVLDAALLPGRTTPNGGACSIRAMTAYGTWPTLANAPIYRRCWLESRHRRRGADPALVYERTTWSGMGSV